MKLLLLAAFVGLAVAGDEYLNSGKEYKKVEKVVYGVKKAYDTGYDKVYHTEREYQTKDVHPGTYHAGDDYHTAQDYKKVEKVEYGYDKKDYDHAGYDKGYRKESVRGYEHRTKGVYHGKYPGKCGNDGFYYNDEYSFVICSNGNYVKQPCAPGTKNSGVANYIYGRDYYIHDLCDVNLVDYGYGVQHHRGSYDLPGYYDRSHAYSQHGAHRDGYGGGYSRGAYGYRDGYGYNRGDSYGEGYGYRRHGDYNTYDGPSPHSAYRPYY